MKKGYVMDIMSKVFNQGLPLSPLGNWRKGEAISVMRQRSVKSRRPADGW